MVFVKSFTIKKVGASHCIWLPKDWGIQKGDMLHIEMVIFGKTYHHTTKAQKNSSIFVTLPKVWPINVGDICDGKVSYATVPVNPYRQEQETEEEEEDDYSEEKE
jgi:hypothetical protein